MLFVLRASLVIGVLSYLALQRDRPGSMALPEPAVTGTTLAAAWNGLPPEMREGASDLIRRAAAPTALRNASRDTLAEADRRPAWRGIEAR